MESTRSPGIARRIAAAFAIAVALWGTAWLTAMLSTQSADEHAAAEFMQHGSGLPVDVGFAQFMSLHHEQAIQMAETLLDAEDTQLRSLARQIHRVQLLELGKMQGWLQLWGQPLLPRSLAMDWMRLGDRPPDASVAQYLLDCNTAPGGMPGLATREQLETLRRGQGMARDQLFLQLMQAHHRGGLPMARFAAGNANLPVVQSLAKRIWVGQAEELQMLQLLSAQVRTDTSPEPE